MPDSEVSDAAEAVDLDAPDGDASDEANENSNGEEHSRGEQRNSDNEDAHDSSSEEEEDGDNEYDLTDKFIAREDEEDEDEQEEASEDEKEKRRRHKRRRERTAELDEEDYQLLEDNQVTGIRRKQQSVRKRIRKQQDTRNKTDAQRLQEELFGAEEGAALDEDDAQEVARAPAAEDNFGESDDEMAGFIDDDDVGRRTGRSRARGQPKDVSSHGIQEMQDIFGDVDDLLEMYAEKKANAVLGRDDEGEEAVMPEDDQDADALAAYEEQQAERQQREKQRRMEAAIEPELMERLMIQPVDEKIRQKDAPERFQLSGEAGLREVFSSAQLDDASRWIVEQLVGPLQMEPADAGEARAQAEAPSSRAGAILEGGILEVDGKPRDGRPRQHAGFWDEDELEEGLCNLSRGTRGLRRKRHQQARLAWRKDLRSWQSVAEAVRRVLEELWNQQHEIPVIASFRKQICGELLSMRAEDRPKWTSEQEVRRRREAGKPEFLAGTVQAKHRTIRRWDVLWAVHDLSGRWRALLRRKEKRLEVYKQALERRQEFLSHQDEEIRFAPDGVESAIQSCIAQIPDAASMEDLDDIDSKFRLAVSANAGEVVEDLGPGMRRPQRTSAYASLKKAGLDSVVRAMAMTATELGENLSQNLKRNQPADSRVLPMDMAYEHVVNDDPAFDGPEKVLERARQVHVAEIVNEPHVRSFVRQQLDKDMLISTAPTPLGETQLDAFHPYGRVKRIHRMPARAFKNRDDYLCINLAEKEGLITVVNEVEELERIFVQPMLDYYQSSAVSVASKEWNTLRSMILREAVQKLVPQLQQEANSRLLSDARAAVLEQFTDQLWKYACMAPLQIRTEEGEEVEKRRLAACCWGEGRPATCMVMLEEQGSLVDVAFLPSFSGQQRHIRPGMDYDIARDPKKTADVNAVVDFCRDNRPQAILVGARNQHCRPLKDDMTRIGDFILDAHAQILTSGHDTGTIEVCYAEETLADLWANSADAKEEFPDHPDVVRRAIALGRLALEPLAVLAALCRPDGKEILSLNLHPLQTHIPEAERLKATEIVIMTAVAQVGADINLMASNSWLAPLLPFVAGLGPRKAQSLLQAVQASEFALNRISLWNDIWKPGNAVFRNCGAFLKVTANARSLVNAEVEAIDCARIEPLSYKLAFRVARSAVDGESGDQEEDLMNVNQAMRYPAKVEALDIEELHSRLAAESEKPEQYNQISTLIDIAMEFIEPNMELRRGNALDTAQAKDQQFWWMFGESQGTLRPGRRVEALVRFVGQNEAKCVLPEIGGMDAILSAKDISSNNSVTPADYLKPGQSVTARIKAIRPEDFCVELTTTSSDLNDDAVWEDKYCRQLNPYYHVLSLEERRAIEAEKRRQARSKVLAKRTIDHPNFKNVNINEAVKLLEERDVGEAIFRPSPKSINMICLTMKLFKGLEGDLIVHKDVKEGRKRGGQLTLGTPLSMLTDGNKTEEKFEDLDEILARYVEPMVDRVKQVAKHRVDKLSRCHQYERDYGLVSRQRKFRDGAWEDIKEILHEEGREMRIAAIYCLCADYLHPGVFFIGSVLPTARRTPRREFFTLSPSGFYYRHKMHKDVERMLAMFKRNPTGQRAEPEQRGNLMPPPLNAHYPHQQMPPAYLQPAPPVPGHYGAFEGTPINPRLI